MKRWAPTLPILA
ncbi:hypothetical protein EAWG_01306 [Escherichia coli TA008]|nr:hypothetical protein EAWG_01306 [Escherichia coli TA008]